MFLLFFYLFISSWSWGTAENQFTSEGHHLVCDYHVAAKNENMWIGSLKKKKQTEEKEKPEKHVCLFLNSQYFYLNFYLNIMAQKHVSISGLSIFLVYPTAWILFYPLWA